MALFTTLLFDFSVSTRVLGKRMCSTAAGRPLTKTSIACGLGSARNMIASVGNTCRMRLPTKNMSLMFDCIKCRSIPVPVIVDGKSVVRGSICVGRDAGLLRSIIISTKQFRRGLDSIAISVSLVGTDSVTHRTPASVASALRAVPKISVVSGRPDVQNNNN